MFEPMTVVVPAYNEAEGVASVVRKIRDVLRGAGIEHDMLVVNDGSTDATASCAAREGARVITHRSNRGYGAALKTGILAARHERIVIIDADGTYPAEPIPEMLRALDRAEMVVGARTQGHKTALARRAAKWILRTLANQLAQTDIPDINSGLRAFRKACALRYLDLLPDSFSFTTTITLTLLRNGEHISYLPVEYHQRVGRSKIVPWDVVNFLKLLARLIVCFNPLRVFGPLALAAGGCAIIKGSADLLLAPQRHLSPAAMTMCGLSVSLLLAGALAQRASKRIWRQGLCRNQRPLDEPTPETTQELSKRALSLAARGRCSGGALSPQDAHDSRKVADKP